MCVSRAPSGFDATSHVIQGRHAHQWHAVVAAQNNAQTIGQGRLLDICHAFLSSVTPFFLVGYESGSMTGFVSIFWAILCPLSLAGTVSLETDSAVEVQIGGATIARATGPGTLTIGELPEGSVTMRFIRAGRAAMDSTIEVSRNVATNMRLVGDTLTVQGTMQSMQPMAQPIVILRPAMNQSFTVVINEQRRLVFETETVIDDLGPGTHRIEFRSPDQTLVWVRGTLHLDAGDAVALNIEEGRMVTTDGAENAWHPQAGR